MLRQPTSTWDSAERSDREASDHMELIISTTRRDCLRLDHVFYHDNGKYMMEYTTVVGASSRAAPKLHRAGARNAATLPLSFLAAPAVMMPHSTSGLLDASSSEAESSCH